MSATVWPGPVLVMGAGAVGCYLGGQLQAAGAQVYFVGRPRVLDSLRTHGLALSSLDGGSQHLAATHLSLHAQVPHHVTPALVLLTVKSAATAEAAAELSVHLPPGTSVISMQNGVSNAGIAQQHAPALRVWPGMVPYNVVELGPGRFHRGTSGTLVTQDAAALRHWPALFQTAGLALQLEADMRAVQWGKLLLNLNNPVNALSGLPLRPQLLDRALRCCTSTLIDEALVALEAAGITPAQVTPVPPARLPMLMRLPTWLFRLIAARSLRIDEQARSSMADDLARDRPTEVDALCGEVVSLARSTGRDAPRNARMIELIKAWPQARQTWTGSALQQALQSLGPGLR